MALFKSLLTTSSWTIAGRKTKLLTNAGTTAEGVKDEAVRSLTQVLVHGSRHFPGWISDEIASYRKRRRAWREGWSSALHPPSYTAEADGSKQHSRARLRDAPDKHP